MNLRWTSWLWLAVRWYLGGVFLVACVHKIIDPTAFAVDVATYQILPTDLINLVALILPWVELLAGALLVLGYRTRAAALLIDAMLLVFIVALAVALARGLDMGCGCFASDGGDDPISWRTVLRDLIWLALGLGVLVWDHRPLGLDRWLHSPSKSTP